MINQTDVDAMKDEQDQGIFGSLTEFIKTYGGSLDPRLWLSLIEEELAELAAEKPNTPEHLKEYTDVFYVMLGFQLVLQDNFSELMPDEELAKAQETIGRVQRTAAMFRETYTDDQIDKAFALVHASNMSKLGEDGKPIRREDGKILKGPNYKPADLSVLFPNKKDV